MNAKLPLTRTLQKSDPAFTRRHVGPGEDDQRSMLSRMGLNSVDELIDQTIPASIRLSKPLDIEPALSERDALAELKTKANKNKVNSSLIGQGYYNTLTPAVIARNVLENPGWYTRLHALPT